MKRFHVHVAVNDVAANIRFYSSLFGAQPSVVKGDYAKWMLEDPRINFAISKRTLTGKPGINHLGLQTETDGELEEIHARVSQTVQEVLKEQGVECCYAKSDKYWAKDPQGIAWEAFRSLDTVRHYYGEEADAQATGASLLNHSTDGACGSGGCATGPDKPAQTKGRFSCCQ